MSIYIRAFLVGVVYYTVGFLAFWFAATPYSKNLGTDAFADGIWAQLFPYWTIGQIGLAAWVCYLALALPAARHRALMAGLGAGFLSLLGLILLGLEDVARVWLDVIGIAAGVVFGIALDRMARQRSLRLPAARHLLWLWLPGAVFLAGALLLVNSAIVSLTTDVVGPAALWLLLPLLAGIVMIIGWQRLVNARGQGGIAQAAVASVLVLAGAVAPALITALVFRDLFVREVAGF